MKPKDISLAKDPNIRGSLEAMKRAAKLARQVAIDTNTAIVVMQDGKMVEISADQLRRELAAEAAALEQQNPSLREIPPRNSL